jgi:glutathione S-transferase
MGSIQKKPEIILYDYQFAPNAQKARNLLHHLNLPYRSVPQPFFIPRNDILDLGITYRRVPVCCIGKDVYPDNRTFLDAILNMFPDEAKNAGLLPRPCDESAFEMFGYRTFWICLPLVPKELNSKQLQEDRMSLFKVFAAENYEELRPSALAEFRAVLDDVENEFLGDGRRFVGGERLSVSDLHAMWMIKWALQTIGVDKEPGFGKEDWPRVYAWIDGVKKHDEAGEAESVSHDDAKRVLLSSEHAAKEVVVDSKDPTGLKKGQRVSVGSSDE